MRDGYDKIDTLEKKNKSKTLDLCRAKKDVDDQRCVIKALKSELQWWKDNYEDEDDDENNNNNNAPIIIN